MVLSSRIKLFLCTFVSVGFNEVSRDCFQGMGLLRKKVEVGTAAGMQVYIYTDASTLCLHVKHSDDGVAIITGMYTHT